MTLADRSSRKFLTALSRNYKSSPGRWQRIHALITPLLLESNITSGAMLEIGGRKNPRNECFPQFSYTALDLDGKPHSSVAVVKADITHCPQIPDASFDFIFSLDVFEHISKPWLAASEIRRILKPGGLTFHSTLFSWRYHPCPIDYWRYTPECLIALFEPLKPLHAAFDYTERRRNILGKDKNRAPVDELGGWRENVRVNYAGLKR